MNGYIRRYISMFTDKEEQAARNLKAIGKCIIEIMGGRGKISVIVQNLDAQVIYKLFILVCEKDKTEYVCLGNYYVDAKGRGEMKIEIDAENIKGTNVRLADVNVVALVLPEEARLRVPLVGYREGRIINWKNNFKYPEKQHKPEPKIQEAPSPGPKTQDEEIKEIPAAKKDEENKPIPQNIKSMEQKEKPEEKINIHEAFKILAKKFREEIEELETDKSEKEIKTQQSHFSEEDALTRVFINNPKMNPFVRQNKDVNWIRTSFQEVTQLPLNQKKYINQPFITEADNKYRHLILGSMEEYDRTIYLLGVPGLYDPTLLPKIDDIGFVQFKCCEDTPPRPQEHGYWILPLS